MKRLYMLYVISVLLLVTIPVGIVFIGRHPADKGDNPSGLLPETIRVYMTDSGTEEELPFEDYILGVLPAEMPASFELEALKAQAVAARTYAYNRFLNADSQPEDSPHPGCAVCTDSTHCSAYITQEKLIEVHGQEWYDQYWDKVEQAVHETQGQIITYNGQPISAVYHSASAGGRTESSKDVWGGEVPYLVSVETAGEEEKNNYNTEVTVPFDEFKEKLKAQYPDANLDGDPQSWPGLATKSDGGNVLTMVLGGVEVRGVHLRSIFGLASTNFDLIIGSDSVQFKVRGSGHGVGMSQYGANYMAKQGKSYEEIIQHYYTGVQLEK